MEIKDLIKSEKDRIFVLDRECFIIFTGDDLTDEKPFIRIGTWTDLPSEIIPLTENIIITDNNIGTPTIEQFNINIRDLETNRYVGSNNIIENYLGFQKNFNLNLQNASIVKIEDSLSQTSKEKSISQKNQYVGLFYKNGNFKTLFDNNTIFDLESSLKKTVTISTQLNKISKTYEESSNFSEPGFINFKRYPIFYNNNYFTCSNIDDNYINIFSLYGIDPYKIKEFITPIIDIIKISDFIKWKNETSNNIRIFSDNSAEIKEFKKIYSKSNIVLNNFSNIDYNSGNGLKFKNIHNTNSNILTFSQKNNQDIKVLFLNDNFNQFSEIKDDLDLIILPYTLYEKNNLLLKSSTIPLVISEDNNKNISKLCRTNNTVIFSNIQYNFSKISQSDELINYLKINKNLSKLLFNENLQDVEIYFQQFKNQFNLSNLIELFNSIAFIKLRIFSTTDRHKSSNLWDSFYNLKKYITEKNIQKYKNEIKITLVIINNTVLQIATEKDSNLQNALYEKIEDSLTINSLASEKEINFYNKIIEDRKRLTLLLQLYKEKSPYYIKNTVEIKQLSESLKQRKLYYEKQINQIMFKTDKKTEKTTINIDIKKIFIVALPIIIILLIFFLYNNKPKNNKIIISKTNITNKKSIEKKISISNRTRIDNFVKKIPKEVKDNYIITISDIHKYANLVAQKNGYASITKSNFKDKSPHWIFPGNIFILLDETKIIVYKGDTLWEISENKLIQMNYNFNKQLNEYLKSSKKLNLEQLQKLEKFAFSKKLKNELKELKNND